MGTNSSPRAHSVASHGEQEPPLRTKPRAHTHAHPSQASVSPRYRGAKEGFLEKLQPPGAGTALSGIGGHTDMQPSVALPAGRSAGPHPAHSSAEHQPAKWAS